MSGFRTLSSAAAATLSALALIVTTDVCVAASPAGAASAVTKVLKCGKGTEKVKVVSLGKAPTAGYMLVNVTSPMGHKQTVLKTDAEVKDGAIAAGADLCVDKGED